MVSVPDRTFLTPVDAAFSVVYIEYDMKLVYTVFITS